MELQKLLEIKYKKNSLSNLIQNVDTDYPTLDNRENDSLKESAEKFGVSRDTLAKAKKVKKELPTSRTGFGASKAVGGEV